MNDPHFDLYAGAAFVRGQFLARRDRFTLRCLVEGNEELAHLPNPGRLWERLLPGTELLLLPTPNRAMKWRAVAQRSAQGLVMLDAVRTNAAVQWLLERGLVPGFEGCRLVQAEAAVGHSRFDFKLEESGKPLYLEVKSCTLFSEHVAMFPDAPTERGRKHLLELAHLADEGTPCGVLFFVQSAGARFFLPDWHTDPAFAATLLAVRGKLRVVAVGAAWTEQLSLRLPLTSLEISWHLAEREGHNGGSFILVLRLQEPHRFVTASGPVLLTSGHYVYGEDAPEKLDERVKKACSGLTLRQRPHSGDCPGSCVTPVPIRSSEPLSRRIEQSLQHLGESVIENEGHFLLRFADAPFENPAFVHALLHYRMERLTRFV